MSADHGDAPRHFFWHELVTTDPEGATDFYGAVVGWRALPVEGSGAAYWTFVPVHQGTDVQGGPSRGRGGLARLPARLRGEGIPSRWHGHVWSPDADRDADRAVSMGGRRAMETRIVPSVGRLVVIQDPQGAALALVTPDPPTAPGKESTDPGPVSDVHPGYRSPGQAMTGRFTWHELATADPEAALQFYGGLFGWEETRSVTLTDGGRYRFFGSHGVELGGIYAGSDADDGLSDWLHYLRVGNLEESLRRVGKSGGELVHGPTEAPHGRIAHCRDPQGAWFALREEESKDRPSP